MTVADLIDRLKKLPRLAEIHAFERVVRDDGAEVTLLLLAHRKRADGSIGPEYMHASLGGFGGVWSATQDYADGVLAALNRRLIDAEDALTRIKGDSK